MLVAALLLAALQATALAVAPAPQTRPVTMPEDPLSFAARCLAISAQVRQSENPPTSARGTAQSLYYFGRIHGRLSEGEVQARIVEELHAMDGVDPHAVDRACDRFLPSRGATLSRIGQGIVAGAVRRGPDQ